MSVPRSHHEVEAKFDLEGRFDIRDLAELAETFEDVGTTRLEATYYDTSDLRLAREHVTLRRRNGGTDAGWHLKLPIATATRREFHVDIDNGNRDAPPVELTSLVRAITRDDELAPVARLRTTRRMVRLSNGDAQVEVCDDDVTTLALDGPVTSRFREIEIELLGVSPRGANGPQRRLFDTAQLALTKAGAVPASAPSKLARTLGAAAAQPPEVGFPPPSRRGDSAGVAVRAHIARNVIALRAADQLVRTEAPDGIHQMRVSCRRLRSGLRVFRPLVDEEWAEKLREELAWVADGLGAYRDTEVLMARLTDSSQSLPPEIDGDAAREAISTILSQRLEVAKTQVRDVMTSERYLRLHADLVLAAVNPPLTSAASRSAEKVLPPLVKTAWKKFSDDSDRVVAAESGRSAGATNAEWHAVRIQAKRLRYTVDAVAEVFGSEAQGFAKRLAVATDALGEHQDAAIAAATVHQVAVKPDCLTEGEVTAQSDKPDVHACDSLSAEAVFALGSLYILELNEALAIRSNYALIWRDVRRRRWRKWLST